MSHIEDLYTLAAKGERTIKFATERDAVRFRLRMYKEKTKKANLFWPEITILLRGNTLVMGPKGFDLPHVLDDETLEALAQIDKENEQRENERLLALQAEYNAQRAKPKELMKAMFGKDRTVETKEAPTQKNVEAPFDPYAAEENATKSKET